MQIEQKNVFGKNIINLQPVERDITENQKKEILDFINTNGITSVSLRFEYSAEAKDFAKKVSTFLKASKLNVYGEDDTRVDSGINRGEFYIQKHPSDNSFAIINIGSIF